MQKFSGTDYLKIDIASNYGLDKEPWEKRLAWFSLHEHCLMEMLATSDKPGSLLNVASLRATQSPWMPQHQVCSC